MITDKTKSKANINPVLFILRLINKKSRNSTQTLLATVNQKESLQF